MKTETLPPFAGPDAPSGGNRLEAIRHACPHNALGGRIVRQTQVYKGTDHPHTANSPRIMTPTIPPPPNEHTTSNAACSTGAHAAAKTACCTGDGWSRTGSIHHHGRPGWTNTNLNLTTPIPRQAGEGPLDTLGLWTKTPNDLGE